MRSEVINQIRRTFFALIFLGTLTAAALAQTTNSGVQQSSDTAVTTPKPATQQESTTRDTAADKAAAKPMTPEEARQAQLVADTNKLLELSQELKAEVAKSKKDTLSLAVIKQ